ncbi:MAG TPA: PQQ-binding-like beta-propeller repeat protein, partial [Pirellulales bacterium]|nr:PQQ-binding-like beta-propeller repeat protein [Pirellulales bacterium]
HEQFDQQVASLQEEALRSESIEEMRSFDFFFGTHPSAVPVKQKLVDLLIAAGEGVESITLLKQLSGMSDPAIQQKATAKLALLHKEPEMAGQGAKHIWPEGKVLLKQTGATARGRRLGYQSSMPVRMLSRRDHAMGTVMVDQRQFFRIYGLNSYGQIDWTVPLLDKKENRANLMANHRLSCVRAKGQILVAAVGQQVLAIDTFQARQESSPASILWRQDTLSPGSGSRSKSLRSPRRNERRPWEDEAKTQQQLPLLISRIGPITDGGVTFVRNRNLVSVDPITGEVLWIRKGYEREAELFGDREFVMVLPPGKKEVQVLSAMDGRLLGTRMISKEMQRWTTVGRHILIWRKVVGDNPFKGRWELALYDPWAEKNVWSQPISGDTKGDLVGLDAVALYDKAEGRFVVLDIFSGERLLDEPLEVDMHIKGVYVVRSEEIYMLVTNRGAQYPRNNKTPQIQPMPQGTGSAFVSGNIYAFDRATGKALWDRPAKLEQWGLALQQPVDLPVLVFARRVIDRKQKPNSNSLSFLFMDKQTGRAVVPIEKRTNREYNFEIEGDPEKNTVSVLFKNSTLTLQFTDTPVSPAGPVQLPAEKPEEKGGITSLIHSVLDVIGKAKATPAAKKNKNQ